MDKYANGEMEMTDELDCYVAWSACETCLNEHGIEVDIGYNKLLKKWEHLEKSWCNSEPIPLEVMV